MAWGMDGRTNDAPIELIVWAREEIVTALELEPFDGARLPIRMPVLESIRPYPDCGDSDEYEAEFGER
jgi:hypothetical protein